MGISIYAVHINHKIRPVDCDVEAEHARRICIDFGIPFNLLSVTVRGVAEREKISGRRGWVARFATKHFLIWRMN